MKVGSKFFPMSTAPINYLPSWSFDKLVSPLTFWLSSIRPDVVRNSLASAHNSHECFTAVPIPEW